MEQIINTNELQGVQFIKQEIDVKIEELEIEEQENAVQIEEQEIAVKIEEQEFAVKIEEQEFAVKIEEQEMLGKGHTGFNVESSNQMEDKEIRDQTDICNKKEDITNKYYFLGNKELMQDKTISKVFPYDDSLKKDKTIIKCTEKVAQQTESNKILQVGKQGCNKKQHSCYECGAIYQCLYRLKIHIRTHTGEKPYSCKECGKCFTNSDNLRRHTRIHTGERPYSCKICGKSFNLAGYLKIHNRTHTGEKLYSCDVCNRRFTQATALKAHERTHTGVKAY
ncbi:unnamed protein product, partial [Leptidea sinapis]